jgi:hypothetical protein
MEVSMGDSKHTKGKRCHDPVCRVCYPLFADPDEIIEPSKSIAERVVTWILVAVVVAASVAVFCLVSLIVADKVNAADYYEIGIGRAKLERNKGVGWWQQDGADQVYSEQNPTWSVRAGWDVRQWLAVELGARDLGRLNTVGSFVSDAAYGRILAGQCAFPCGDPVVSTYGEGRVYGLDARLKLSGKWGEFRPYGTIGLFAFRSTYSVDVVMHDNSGVIWHEYTESEQHVRPTFSAGIEYKRVFAEITVDPHVGTENSDIDRAVTVTVGGRF